MSNSPEPRHPRRHWLITGAAGFIGARMVEHCRSIGIEVTSVDDLPAFDSRPEHASIDFGRKISKDALMQELRSGSIPKPDAIIHLGACSSTTELNVEFLRRVNIVYSQDLWTYCTRESIPFIYASSAATYGEGELGYDDDESRMASLRPLNPYGDSKRLFDIWAVEQERLGNHPPIWSGHKFFNVYGFGERHKGGQASVVLHAFDQIRKTGRVKLFQSHRAGIRDGEQKRDFVWVGDVVDVLDYAVHHPLPRGIYNLGSGQARTFLDLARAVFASLGLPEKIDFIPTPESIRERYQYFTEARMEKLRAAGYTAPFASLESGVEKTVQALLAEERRRTTATTPAT
jgi:ADP-L-glycero-D-manno-heptose 6-epimerase